MKKNINNEKRMDYFGRFIIIIHKRFIWIQSSQNNEIASLFQDSFVDLKNDVNKKRIPKNKNANKVFDIGEKILTLINNKNWY